MQQCSSRSPQLRVSFTDAVVRGTPEDGGLFCPVDPAPIDDLVDPGSDFTNLASALTHRLLAAEIDGTTAADLVGRSYRFGPVLRRLEERLWLLELFHGPTGAFKDFGAAFLAGFLGRRLESGDGYATILVATSGDTGGAVAAAFHRAPRVRVVVLYPRGRVSPLQERQLTALGGNIHVAAVAGSFDECQRLVKEAFADRHFSQEARLCPANSINIGRLIPQSFYYIYAAARVPSAALYCVPSGNFGNVTAGLYAHHWGMPAKGFLAATNTNDVVPRYLDSGEFSPVASAQTISNAMDVGTPSNLERIRFLYADSVAAIKKDMTATSVSEPQTRSAMRLALDRYGLLVDPHTAVGLHAAWRHIQAGPGAPVVVLSTAHPGKFPETVRAATGVTPPPLPALGWLGPPGPATPLRPHLDHLKAFLRRLD